MPQPVQRPSSHDETVSWIILAVMLVLSVGTHLVTVVLLPDRMAGAKKNQKVEMEFYEPPPPPKVEEPEPPKPKPPEPAPLAPKPIERKPAAPRANASTTSTTQGEPAATRSDADTPLTGARFDADYLHNPAPAYPSYSRRMKERGTVFVLVQVSAEGNALQVTLHQSSGYDRLDEAALQAVKQWRFVPAKRGATPVAASVVVPIQFKQ